MKSLLDQLKYDLIVVDSMNLAHRAHYGMKALSHNGKPTGMLYGIGKLIDDMQRLYPGAKIVFLWEGLNSKRESIFSDYKGNRKAKDTEFGNALAQIPRLLSVAGVDQMYHIGLEADDMAGYLVENLEDSERALLVSMDEDWFQYLRPDQVDLQRKRNVIETYSDIRSKLGFPPERMGIYKILKGDKSDNITGIYRLPSPIAKALAIRCADYREIQTFPLVKLNPKWERWQKAIRDQWDDVIERNARLILWNEDWIREDDIVLMKGEYDPEALQKILLFHGMENLAKSFEGREYVKHEVG